MGYTYAGLERSADKGVRWTGFSNTGIVKNGIGRSYALRYYNADLVVWTPKAIYVVYEHRTTASKIRINYALPNGRIDVEPNNTWVFRHGNGKKFLVKSGMRIANDGKVSGAGNYAKWWAKTGPEIKRRRNEQARLRYWRRMRDMALRPERFAPEIHKPTHKLSVESILAERNTTIRMVMAAIYGIPKFLEDAKAEVVNSEAGYDLLRFNLGNSEPRWASDVVRPINVQALKMVCPSTDTTYIETVPPNMANVRAALDWRFQTQDYLGRVGQQT